jgi:hypothetical protein
MKKLQIAIFTISLAAAMSASASITYSGTALSGLTPATPYGPSSDSQYVPASGSAPALRALSTSDSGDLETSGDDPAVFVQGPMGTLSFFSASYQLYGNATGPSGTAPYWILWVSAPGNPSDLIGIIGMGGPTLNSSSAIHVVYADQSYWGQSLGSILNDTYNGVAFGDMTVDWAGVEIGNWDNGDSIIPASANIDSITVPGVAPVPEPTTMIAGALLLLPFGASTLRILRKSRAA